ncbi:MAG: hypothetical protein GX962_09375, partial [Epulopiscium sp.]|nr:hypothetical protein [Candidatus Epulonipiscium sp.]
MMNPMMGRGCPYMNNYLMPTMPVTYSETDMDEKDMEYMKHLHSEICKKIQPHIEAECDRMDHEDSPLYREYPDRETIEQMVDRICACVEENMKIQGESVEAMQEMAQQYGYGNRQDLLRSLVGALLLSEIFGRRRPRRRRRRRFDRYNFPY